MKLGPVFGLLSGVAAAGTVFVALDVVGTLLYQIADPGQQTPEAAAGASRSATETVSTAEPQTAGPTASGSGSESGTVSVAPSAQAAAPAGLDLAAGEKVFKKCTACHDAKAGGKNKTGPNLWGVVNRPPHAAEGFKYSEAMLGHDAPWSPEELDRYLTNPKTAIAGNKMAFAGLPKAADRMNLIAWLAGQSDSPLAPEALPFAAAAAEAGTAAAPTEATAKTAETAAEAEIAQIAYTNPPERSAEELAVIEARVAALKAELPSLDYQRARYHPIHFPPMIETASNEECLVCHQEIIEAKPRAESPAGLKAADSIAWYQTLDTYTGEQADFHWRHLQSEFAVEVMNLECNFCHKGNDPREESPDMMPLRATFSAGAQPEFTNRKMVNPETTCLRCHGAMPDPVNIMGLSGPWHEARVDLEDPSDPSMVNGCLSCHGELFRTNRHNVTYLKAANIEDLAKEVSSDTCLGCHGGRAWYRISYPYPRHAWPGMDPEVPEWAASRPTESDEAYRLAPSAGQ